MDDIVYILRKNKVLNRNVLIVKAYCVFDVMSYPLLTLTVLRILNRVATGQGKVREIQGQGKVREF